MRAKPARRNPYAQQTFLLVAALISVLLILAGNFAYQIYRKPADLLNLLGFGKAKTLQQTWKSYKPYFYRYSIGFITPEYLAALAQTESAGNPFATPKWRLKFAQDWSRFYSPESTAVGLFQLTNPTFAKASQFCVRDGEILRAAKFGTPKSCWFNWTYLRISPKDSTQIVSAHLYQETGETLGSLYDKVSDQTKRRVASLIHLCGRAKANEFLKRKFNLEKLGLCWSYNPSAYIHRVEFYERHFAAMN
jgi:hypothetical protein